MPTFFGRLPLIRKQIHWLFLTSNWRCKQIPHEFGSGIGRNAVRVFWDSRARIFPLWRVKFLLPEPKRKNSRATFFQTLNRHFYELTCTESEMSKKPVIMSKHLTDSERLHIVEEYLGSPGASMPSRRSTTSPRGLLETIVRHFCDMTIGLFLTWVRYKEMAQHIGY